MDSETGCDGVNESRSVRTPPTDDLRRHQSLVYQGMTLMPWQTCWSRVSENGIVLKDIVAKLRAEQDCNLGGGSTG
jgi:hypothetical protein